MPKFELFGTGSCPYTQEMREWLEWKGHEYVEYDVEMDTEARARMIAISGGQRTVPILAEDGDVVQIGWQGRGCVVGYLNDDASACDIRVRGVVQGVGFRPFVFRLAQANTLAGWVLNDEEGVEIHLEGSAPALDAFVRSLTVQSPPAASIDAIDVQTAQPTGVQEFTIRDSRSRAHPSVRISPDLPVCDACLAELFDPAEPAVPLSVHQLHQLRPTLFRHLEPALRPRQHDYAGLAARCLLRQPVPRSCRPPFPCAACRVPGLRAALLPAGGGPDSHR